MLNQAIIISIVLTFLPTLYGLTETLPSPLLELLAISEDFQHISGINDTINEVTACLTNTFLESRRYTKTSDITSENSSSVSIECKDPRAYRACFNAARIKLNECIPGRGDTIQSIHDAIYHEFCMDGGGEIFLELSKSNGDSCMVDFDAEECNSIDAFEEWEARDTCKSFRAYKKCQTAAFSTCQGIKLTQIIREKIRQAGKSLHCEDVIPFATPLEELNRIQDDCESKGISGFKQTRMTLRKCFANYANMKPMEEESNEPTGKVHCEDLKKQSDCWKTVTDKINECIPGRGTTVVTIYTTLLDVTCQDADKLKSLNENQLCNQDRYNSTISRSCKQIPELSSPDLCKSFTAQRSCEQGIISECEYKEHKELILKHLQRVQEVLKCKDVPSDVPDHGSNPAGTPNNSSRFLEAQLMSFTAVLLFSIIWANQCLIV